jgi:7-cyano-7-deazaguanine synthase
MKQVVLSLSGGMDSSSLLLNYLRCGYNVTAISFDYGQKHRVELSRAADLVSYLQSYGLSVTHNIVKIEGLGNLLDSTLLVGGADVPEGHYAEDNMRVTVVPNRNKIFSSIIQAVALSVAQRTGKPVEIAMGIHAGDHAIYPDCRKEFRDADYAAFVVGNWGAEKVTMFAPYLHLNKFDILKDAVDSCNSLGIDFDRVFKSTNTSYKPMMHDGIWYSDYKSAASVERIEAFINLGRKDPVEYADETGPVSWEVARAHAESVLAQHAA